MTYDYARDANGGASHEHDEIEQLRRRIQELGGDFASVDKRLRAALRERPVAALVTAVAAGFILGRIIGRS
jgi:hypothetical protein